jgi:peptidoglycan/LPS O-acetylase OafA/YrhL
MERKHYGAIDGLRTIACIGIVMMHMRANNQYALSGYVYDNVIVSFTDFVFLFMVISAFGMCYGYYDRILNNRISLESFYGKRYQKILPFFVLLVLLDICLSPSKASLIEGLADVTLLFGLFPNSISVIGVGWFLGLIFAFYLMFPAYCVLIANKKRAWIAFAVSVLLSYVFAGYFGIDRANIVYSLPYFIAGGLIYLYREELENVSTKFWVAMLLGVMVCIVLYYMVGANTVTQLLLSSVLLSYALGKSHVGGYWKTGLQSSSVPSVWRFTFRTWLYFVHLKNCISTQCLEMVGFNMRLQLS